MKQYYINNFDVLAKLDDNTKVTLADLSLADVEQIGYSQAWIIQVKGKSKTGFYKYAILQSYNTLVAMIDFTTDEIYCSGTYSRTTIDHISKFARKYGYNYYDFKEAITK